MNDFYPWTSTGAAWKKVAFLVAVAILAGIAANKFGVTKALNKVVG